MAEPLDGLANAFGAILSDSRQELEKHRQNEDQQIELLAYKLHDVLFILRQNQDYLRESEEILDQVMDKDRTAALHQLFYKIDQIGLYVDKVEAQVSLLEQQGPYPLDFPPLSEL